MRGGGKGGRVEGGWVKHEQIEGRWGGGGGGGGSCAEDANEKREGRENLRR